MWLAATKHRTMQCLPWMTSIFPSNTCNPSIYHPSCLQSNMHTKWQVGEGNG